MTTTITHTTRVTWAGTGGLDITGTVAKTADAEQNRILAIAGTTPDQQFDLDFPFADLQSIFLLSNIALKIETNAADAAGGDTINLAANVPFTWTKLCGQANPFTANVTTIFVSPVGAVAGQLDIRVLYDSAA